MKPLIILALCALSVGCGSGSKAVSGTAPLVFSNGKTLATATSYWTGKCAIVFVSPPFTDNQTMYLEFTDDSAFKGGFPGAICTGTYSQSTQGGSGGIVDPMWIDNGSCSTPGVVVNELQALDGSIASTTLQGIGLASFSGAGYAPGNTNLPFGEAAATSLETEEACQFTLVEGQIP